MSVPFKIVYLIKDGETGENLIQTDELLELNAIDGAKIIDNSIPSAKLNIIDGEKIANNSIPISKLMRGFDLVYQVPNVPPASLKIGMPVYWNSTNFVPANASVTNKTPTAIVSDIFEDYYVVQFSGTFTTTNSNWDLITDDTGGLSTLEGQNRYYLSNSEDGFITNESPIYSVPIYNCLSNNGTNSTVEIKFGVLYSSPSFDSFAQEREVFIGDGTEDTFSLSKTPYSRNTTMVTIDGAVLQNNTFTISNKDIIISIPPGDESEIEITYLTQPNFSYANVVKHVEMTTESKTNFILPITPRSENEIMAWVGGSYQDSANFTLNGNIIVFDTPIDINTKVQFIIFNAVQFSDLSYIKRKTLSIQNNGVKTLINAFGEQSSGRYDFHVMSNPLISGTIRLQETNPINVRVETFSTSVTSTVSSAGKLNIYINNDGNLQFQNLLGISITLMLERHQ
jgi:hypothetical protein